MAIVVKPITVEVSKPNVFQAIAAKQNDCNSRFLKVTFVNEGEKIFITPSASVTINAKRNDGEDKSYFGEVNDDGTATLPITSDMLALPGYVSCDVSIIEGNSKLTSTAFTILVEEASCVSGETSKDPQYDAMIALITTQGIVDLDAITPLPYSLLRDINTYRWYFSDLAEAITKINEGLTTGEIWGVTENDSKGIVYLNTNGIPEVVLKEDVSVAATLSITKDMILNLNGKCITLAPGARFNIESGANVKIDGRIEGSKISKSVDSTTVVEALVYSYGNLDVCGGAYGVSINSTTTNAFCFVAHSGGSINICNAHIKMELLVSSSSATKGYYGINVNGGYCKLDNCEINAFVASALGYGILNRGELVMSNTKIFSDACGVNANTALEKGVGVGVFTDTKATIIDCDIYGVYSGVMLCGETFIKGGVYKGSGFGGIILQVSERTNAEFSAYLENAILKNINYEGNHKADFLYSEVLGNNKGKALYVDDKNLSVYLDNCHFVGRRGVLWTSDGDEYQNNSVYMSNCTASGENKSIHISNNTHKLYLGLNNNITAEDTDLPEAVVTTDEIYIKREGEI